MSCTEGHWNLGNDICADCGEDLNPPSVSINRYIIEPRGDGWLAYIENRPDLGEGTGTAPLYALRDFNIRAWNAKWSRDEEKRRARIAAFKSMRCHFRKLVGYPIWGPHWLLKRLHPEAVERHYNLVQRIAGELDRRGGGTWLELAATVNEEWKG